MDELELELYRALDAGPGTFLNGVMGGQWSHADFMSLLRDMASLCEKSADTPTVSRRLAAGFWFLDTWLRDQVHLNPISEQYPAEYYEEALEKVSFISQWFFEGHCPFEHPCALSRELDDFDARGAGPVM